MNILCIGMAVTATLTPVACTAPADTAPAVTAEYDLGIPYGFDEPFDVTPPQQLHVVYTDESWAIHTGSTDGWGGDAALAWADADCLDAGGTPDWENGLSMVCFGVDY